MKKIFYLSIFSVLSVFVAQAQIKKGDILLGGSLSGSHSTADGNYYTGIYVYPSIGKAVKDDLVVGVNLQYGHYTNDYIVENGYKTDTYGLGGFVRKYKPLGNSGFSLFLEGSLLLNYSRTNTLAFEGTSTTTFAHEIQDTYTATAGFSPGIAYRLSEHALLETSFLNMGYISYAHVKNETESSTGEKYGSGKGNSIIISTNLSQAVNSFAIGVKFII